MERPHGSLHFVVALPAEARPLVRHFGLAPEPGCEPYRVFTGERRRLIVSGVGAHAAAAACGFLQRASGGGRTAAWLNAGTGGHARLAPGEIRFAHKITEAGSERAWYPIATFSLPCPGAEVHSVRDVERRYERDAIHDMEAAAFFAAAVGYSTAELVHAVKVVADNPTAPPERLGKRELEALVEGALAVIDVFAGALLGLSEDRARLDAPPPYFAELVARFRFSHTERIQLRELLRRFRLTFPGDSPEAACASGRDARSVLELLRHRLAGAPIRIG